MASWEIFEKWNFLWEQKENMGKTWGKSFINGGFTGKKHRPE
jgi:hypothetical protein